jgi:hypothetical protein
MLAPMKHTFMHMIMHISASQIRIFTFDLKRKKEKNYPYSSALKSTLH